MNKNFLLLNRLLPSTRKAWIIYVICVFTAAIFWLFLTFSRQFETVMTFKLIYEGLPKNKILINEPLNEISVRVKGRGFDLFRYTLTERKKKITLNLNSFTKIKRKTVSTYFKPLTGSPYSLLSTKSPLKILSYSKDTLLLKFDDVTQKKVPLLKEFLLKTDSSLFVTKINKIFPDSIFVFGSKDLLENVHAVKPFQNEFLELSKTKSYAIALEKLPGVLNLQPDSVYLDISVEPISQYQLNVPIICADCPDSLEIKFFPSHAKVSFNSIASVFKKVKSSEFKIEVNFDEVLKGNEKVFIRLNNAPENVNQLTVSPAKAEYLIRK